MKKALIVLSLTLLAGTAHAFRRNGEKVLPTFQNHGNAASGFSVAVTSSTVATVYTGDEKNREVLIENTNATYKVYCATHSAVVATSGNRWVIWAAPSGNFKTNGNYSIFCISEAGAPSIEMLGVIEYDTRD